MGNYQCEALQECSLKKSAAYGLYECLVAKDREYAVVSKSIESAIISADQLREELQKRKQVKSINLVSLCSYTLTPSEGIIQLKLHYEYVPLTLNEKRHVWSSLGKKITETELSNILLGVQNAIIQLYEAGIGHRCINLDTILCLHSLYKLTDISMITFLTGYDLARQGDKDQFLSSHLLNYLHYQGTEPHYSLEDDLFSLAMVVITLVLGCEPQDFYSVDGTEFKKVNRKIIDSGLRIIDQRYSIWIGKKLRVFLDSGLKDPFETSKQSNSLTKTKGSV